MSEATNARPDLSRLDRPFRVIAFDWEAAAGQTREETDELLGLLGGLMQAGVRVLVLTSANLASAVHRLTPLLDGELGADRLFLAAHGGAEIYGFEGRRPVPLVRRTPTPEEERKLDAAIGAVRDALRRHRGLAVEVVAGRSDRRAVDLLPSAGEAGKKGRAGLFEQVQSRLFASGMHGGLREVMALAARAAAEAGLPDARVGSDVRHVEIALCDRADAVDWMARELCAGRGVPLAEALVAGDRFGPLGVVEGADQRLLTPRASDAVFLSVGEEPGGVDAPVLHVGGGPAGLRSVLGSQLARRRGGPPRPLPASPLPLEPSAGEGWTLAHEGVDLAREREAESIYSIGNGYLGTRGALAEHSPLASSPATFLAGVFDALPHSEAVPELAVAPDWTRLKVLVDGRELALEPSSALEHRRILDLRQGASWREWRHRDPAGRVTRLRGLRLASLADRHLVLQALEVIPENWSGRLAVEVSVVPASAIVAGLPVSRPRMLPAEAQPEGGALVYHTAGGRIALGLASASTLEGPHATAAPQRRAEDGVLVERWELEARLGEVYRVDRLASLFTTREVPAPERAAVERLEAARRGGAGALARAHAAAWQERWDDCAVEIEGDPAAQRALRFASYHLVIAANPEDERVSIGARTLTGESYKGHVFWDTDIFMLPFFAYTHPESARALLMYRFHTLEAARAKARAHGFRGALYAWESADTGEETTPRFMLAPDGEVIPILSGLIEHHISADVAFAAWAYWEASGDERFLVDAGAEIVLETARFWASRGVWGEDGRYHIRDVVGPDEYHEHVDDNAFTNRLARWNLERGLEVHALLARRWPQRLADLERRLGLDAAELAEWGRIARGMVPEVDPATGLIEQFAGYFAMEDYDLAPMRAQGKRAAPMDMILGRERTLRSRIVKQADVVMLLQLLWPEYPARVREENFRFYEPRTCHGSSLSPATHALVAARLGHEQTALEYFQQAGEIDLANNMGNAAGGVHAAALGGLWQAAVFGFGGVGAAGGVLTVDPRVPARWGTLRFRLRFRGARLEVQASSERLVVRALAGGPVRLALGEGSPPLELAAGAEERRTRREDGGWRAEEGR